MNEKDFPILKEKVKGKRLIYLDSAASSQVPSQVIDAIKNYQETSHSNVHRSIHMLSEKATEAYEDVRKKVAKFIGANSDEIVFTKGTTESLNLVAFGLNLKKGDEIVLTIMEHHANIVPWQQVAKRTGAILKFIPLTDDFRLDMSEAKKLITKKTKVVSVAHMSNVLGTINQIKELAKLAHENGAIIVVDAAQSIPSMEIDVGSLDCDFLAFSAHKMCGPTGVGVLYGKKELLEKLDPFIYGGKMIEEVSLDKSTFTETPFKFEGGTPNISGVIGLGKAIDYLESVGMDDVEKHEKELIEYALNKINKINKIKIIGPDTAKDRGAILSFVIEGMHSHDVSELLNRDGIAIRGGHHCCMPLHKELGLTGTSRVSFYIYNTKEDVDTLIESLQKAMKVFKI
jgi:cysteine desulfurase/selenocysteine lyase